MPEVSIFPAYCAGAMIAARVGLPETTTANRVKKTIGCDASAYLFARLNPHTFNEKCSCFACEREPKGDWIRAGWMQRDPQRVYVRFDIGARNVRLKLQGGEHFVVVAECDVDEWLATLAGAGRRGMMLALPLMLERKSKREGVAA